MWALWSGLLLPYCQHSYRAKAFLCSSRRLSTPISARTSTLARMSRMAVVLRC
jgi:hypothetical protein